MSLFILPAPMSSGLQPINVNVRVAGDVPGRLTYEPIACLVLRDVFTVMSHLVTFTDKKLSNRETGDEGCFDEMQSVRCSAAIESNYCRGCSPLPFTADKRRALRANEVIRAAD